MNKDIEINRLKSLYFKYKHYLISFGIIFACLLVFLKIIIPQIKQLSDLRKKEAESAQKIKVFNNNLSFLQSISDSELEADLKIVSSALPSEKEFDGVLYAISTAANNATVLIDDFTFQVGKLSTVSAEATAVQQQQENPSLKVTLGIKGDINQTKMFITELSKKLPLSDTVDIKLDKKSSTLSIFFFYKPFSFISYDMAAPLKERSYKDKQLIKEISTWQVPVTDDFPILMPNGEGTFTDTNTSTSSGDLNPNVGSSSAF